nr:uncharacterized protein LOC128696482 [Cherax quadricarinatus]
MSMKVTLVLLMMVTVLGLCVSHAHVHHRQDRQTQERTKPLIPEKTQRQVQYQTSSGTQDTSSSQTLPGQSNETASLTQEQTASQTQPQTQGTIPCPETLASQCSRLFFSVTILPDPNDCSSYCQCTQANAGEMVTCPTGYYFSENRNKCLWGKASWCSCSSTCSTTGVVLPPPAGDNHLPVIVASGGTMAQLKANENVKYRQ